MKNTQRVISEYEWEVWAHRLCSEPIELVESANFGECYEVEHMHVYKLNDGKYATVRESGCSCYESSSADIDLYPTKEAALVVFNKYVKNRKGDI